MNNGPQSPQRRSHGFAASAAAPACASHAAYKHRIGHDERREHEDRFVEERHMDHDCGCGPRRPTATDDEGFLVWPGKVADGPAESWQAHP